MRACAKRRGLLSIEIQTIGAGPMQAEISGIALAIEPGFAGYIPLGHRGGDGDIFGGGLEKDQIPLADALAALKPVLEDPRRAEGRRRTSRTTGWCSRATASRWRRSTT